MNLNCVYILVAIAVITLVRASSEGSPRVTLSHGGVLVGSFMRSVNNKEISAFRGIPYAEPPVGNLRFKSPVSTKPWLGEKLADKDSVICVQQVPYLRVSNTIGEEDCLYLNVYAPKDRNPTKPLSVMYYIHGGAFVCGAGTSDQYGPERILDHDIILVVANYRLGSLGFLSTGTEDCFGNNGLKDQALALKWIHDNIADFGGDPNDVTLFGESAGAVSVTYHMISPLSKDLFHRAIIQSGTNFDPWALINRTVTLERTKKLSKLLKCPEENLRDLMACLKTKTADEIVSKTIEFEAFDLDPLVVFGPVIEPDIEGAFLIKKPQDISIRNQIPIIIGVTADEGIIKSASLINNKFDEFKSRFEEVLPITLLYDNQSDEVQKKVTRAVDQFYFNGKHDWTKTNHQNLTNLYSDRLFYSGLTNYLTNRFKNDNGTAETYIYLFNQKGSKSISSLYSGVPDYIGVAHAEEVQYLFSFEGFDSSDENDAKVKFALPYMWVNFAKTGNPTPAGSEFPEWEPTDNFPLKYAQIGAKTSKDWTLLKNQIGFHENRMEFWRKITTEFLNLS